MVADPLKRSNWGVLRVKHLAAALFTICLLLVFVGLAPFAVRDLDVISQMAQGEGDFSRQLSYMAVFALTVAIALMARGPAALRAFPRPVLLTLIWCLCSAVWSLAPEITLRRAGLTGIVAATVFLAVDMLGPQRSLRLLYVVLVGVLLLNYMSLFVVPQAMHMSGEADPSLVGNWRGLYYHKNIAGPVAALSAILFLHYAIECKRRKDWLLFIGAAIFTVGTQSKTAIGLLAITVVVGRFYRVAEQRPGLRRMFRVSTTAFCLLFVLLALIFKEELVLWLSDPNALTGRGAIWEVAMASIKESPILGSGFGAFWQSGVASPALYLAKESWVMTVSHSHNGYIEILLTTGILGLALATIAAVAWPLRSLLAFDQRSSGLNSLMFSWIFFSVFLNLTETRLFERDRPEWVVWLIALAIIGSCRRKSLIVTAE